jgi:toxin ParE1/3/4
VVRVVFYPIAQEDLSQIFDFIAADSPDRAINYIRQMRVFCLGFADFPERGRIRNDLASGVRTFFFERRVVIAYRIEDQQVVILRLFYAGQQIDKDRFQD